jgi:hypothetical protein
LLPGKKIAVSLLARGHVATGRSSRNQ